MLDNDGDVFVASARSEHPEGDAGQLALKRLETAVLLLRGWVWETDAEGRFTYMSDSVLNFSERPAEWHYGKTRQELGNYLVSEDEQAKIHEQIANHEPFGPIEYQRFQNGQAFWMRTRGMPRYSSDGEFAGYRGIAFDISSEMESRKALCEADRQAEARLKTLTAVVDCFPGAMSVYDSKLRLALANPRYYALLDLPATQFPVGAYYEDLLRFLADRGELNGGAPDDMVDMHLNLARSGEVRSFCRTRPNGCKIEVQHVPLPFGGFLRSYTNVTEQSEFKWQYEKTFCELRDCKAQLQAARREANLLREHLSDLIENQ